jgi:hypothetical protein
MHCAHCGIDIPSASGPTCSLCKRAYDRWVRARIVCIGIAVVIAGTVISMLQDSHHDRARPVASTFSDPRLPDTTPARHVQADTRKPTRPAQPKDNAEQLFSSLEHLRADQQGRLRLEAHSEAQPSVPPDATSVPGPQLVGQPAPSAGSAEPEWPHRTASGTRWSLGSQSGHLLLLVDLGAGRIASIEVAAAFQNLSLAQMSIRVDWLRSVIAQSYFDQPGNYLYTRNGALYRTQ